MKKEILLFLLSTLFCIQIRFVHAQTIPYAMPEIPSEWNIQQNLPCEMACQTGVCKNYTISVYHRTLTADSITGTSSDSSFAIVAEAKFKWINDSLLCGRVHSKLYKSESPRYFIRDNKNVYYSATEKGKRTGRLNVQKMHKTIRSGTDSIVADIAYGSGFNDTVFHFIYQKYYRAGRLQEMWTADFPAKKFKTWEDLQEYKINRFDYQEDGMIKRTVMTIRKDSVSGKSDTVNYLCHFLSSTTDTKNRLTSAKLYDEKFNELIAWYYAYTGDVCTYYRLDFNARIREIAVLRYDDKRKKHKY